LACPPVRSTLPPMPSYIRTHIPGATYFFTVTLADRSSRLLVERVHALRSAYRRVQRRHPFETVAVCVLPDHLHAVWRLPEGDADYASRWQQIKRGFSLACDASASLPQSLRVKREKGIWQRRYWEHFVRDEDDLRRHVDYVHFNPVKHGHAARVADWPYSSFHRWVARGELPAEWGLVQAADGARFGE
jgi:putative transposase